MDLLFNLIFGLVPTAAFAWSLAADEEKSPEERVVRTAGEGRKHRLIFAFVYVLWAATLSMWNWMRGAAGGWSLFWGLAAGVAFAIFFIIRKRARESADARPVSQR